MDYEIIDDALPEHHMKELWNVVMSPQFPWIYAPDKVAFEEDTARHSGYFLHNVYIDNMPWSETYETVMKIVGPFLDDFKSLLRVRFVMYMNTHEVIEHDKHVDYPFDHKGILIYLNDCDGFTRLEDGTKVVSKRNRMLKHNPAEEHNSSTTSDKKARLVLVVNYL